MTRVKVSKFNDIELHPIGDVETTCDASSSVAYSEVVTKVTDIDEKSKKYEKLISRLEMWCRLSWLITGVVTVVFGLILYCATTYVNMVEQRYLSYKENVEQRIENYDKRFEDFKSYCGTNDRQPYWYRNAPIAQIY